MAKLYYGSGQCTIEGADIVGVQISYKGAVRIVDKTTEHHFIMAGNNKIIVFPVGQLRALSDLFEYSGEIKITSVLASNSSGEKVPCTIKRVMDYSEMMDTKSEDLTTKSESLRAGYVYRNRTKKTTLKNKTINNQHIIRGLYLRDGSAYSGAFHVHISGKAMTGGEYSSTSQDLYILKKGKLILSGS